MASISKLVCLDPKMGLCASGTGEVGSLAYQSSVFSSLAISENSMNFQVEEAAGTTFASPTNTIHHVHKEHDASLPNCQKHSLLFLLYTLLSCKTDYSKACVEAIYSETWKCSYPVPVVCSTHIFFFCTFITA